MKYHLDFSDGLKFFEFLRKIFKIPQIFGGNIALELLNKLVIVCFLPAFC